MTFVATAIAGSAVLGYLGSKKAGDAQSDAANRAADMTWAQYEQSREDLAPYRESGDLANQRLLEYLGLATPASRMPDLVAPTKEQFTTTTSAPSSGFLNGGAPSYSTGMSSTGGFQPGYGVSPATGTTTTFDEAGYNKALAEYEAKLAAANQNPEGFGSLLDPFTGEDLESEPGYQFGLREGEKALNRAAARGGTYNSGATLKALTRYGLDYAGTKYGDAYNRNAADKSRTYGMLSGVSGTGANAAGQTAGLGANAANAAGQYAVGAGDARAAGIVGGVNAIGSGVGSYLNYTQNQATLDYLRNLRAPIAGGSSPYSGRM